MSSVVAIKVCFTITHSLLIISFICSQCSFGYEYIVDPR